VVHRGERPKDVGGAAGNRKRFRGSFSPRHRVVTIVSARDAEHHRGRIDTGHGRAARRREPRCNTGTATNVDHAVACGEPGQLHGAFGIAGAPEAHGDGGKESGRAGEAWEVRVMVRFCRRAGRMVGHEDDLDG
jgi:hypothetical protein